MLPLRHRQASGRDARLGKANQSIAVLIKGGKTKDFGLLLVNDSSLEAVEVGDAEDRRGVDIELLLCVLVVVTLCDDKSEGRDIFISMRYGSARHRLHYPPTAPHLALQANPQPAGQATDTALPHLLVQLGVDANVLDTHGLLCKLDDLLDGLGRALLELDIVHALVQVDGVLALQRVKRRTPLRCQLLSLCILPIILPAYVTPCAIPSWHTHRHDIVQRRALLGLTLALGSHFQSKRGWSDQQRWKRGGKCQ